MNNVYKLTYDEIPGMCHKTDNVMATDVEQAIEVLKRFRGDELSVTNVEILAADVLVEI